MSENLLDQRNSFISHLTHDVRNLVSGLEGVLTLLDMANQDDTCNEYIQAARTSANRLTLILLNILETARVDSGNMRISRIPYKFRDEAIGLVEYYEQQASPKGLDFSYKIDEQIPDDLSGDPVALKRILENLLDNAVRYTEEGEVKVSFTQSDNNDQEQCLSVVIEDTGPGMPESLREVMFTPYMNEYDTPGAGSRLGIPLSSMLARLMGGELAYESGSEGGARFTLTIPLDVVVSVGQNTGRLVEAINKDSSVLIVDDNKLNIDVLKKFLASSGVNADTAINGEEAIHQCRQKHYDLVLMDCHMPVMDGFDTTQEIRKLPAPYGETIIVAMTGNDTDESRQLAEEVGMDDYCLKPVSVKAVWELLDQYLPGVRQDRPKP